MMSLPLRFVSLPIVLSAILLGGSLQGWSQSTDTHWQHTLHERLPLYGHRNWIVIADSAYPAQTSSGIETIVSGADQLEVVKQVLASIANSKHVRPIVHVDKELQFVSEKDAPGVSAYRKQLGSLLKDQDQQPMLHDEIISKLNQVSQSFRVLIIKTNMTIPYTSVFLELRASYWSDDDEDKLRKTMGSTKEK